MKLSVLLACCAASSVAAAEQPRLPTNEDLRHVRSISGPQLSPDGKHVLIAVTDDTAAGAASHFWLVDPEKDSARQITFSPSSDKRGERSGRWSADGGTIFFLAKRGEHTQLFHLPMNGGEAQPFDLKTAPQADISQGEDALPPRSEKDEPAKAADPLPIDVDSFSVAPVGSMIALLAKDPQTPGEKKQADEKADAVPVDHDPHGARLYLLNEATGDLTVTAVPANVEQVAWDATGARLIAIADAPNGQGDLTPARSAWLVEAKDPAHPSQLSSLPKTINDAVWSESGKRVYFLAHAEQDVPPGYHDLYEANLADGAVHNLSAGLVGTVANAAPLPTSAGVVQLVQTGTRQLPMRFRDGKHDLLPTDAASICQISTNLKQSAFVWVASGSDQPDRLAYALRLGQTPKFLTLPALRPDSWTRTPAQLVHWKNEGLDIEGLLTLPPQAAQGKVPLILMVHGGPTAAWADGFNPLVDFFLAQGWAVLRPNPRGSTGYGPTFAAANKNDMGGGDYRDLMAGVDFAIANYPIDASRLGYYGYSYGGEMAGFVEGRTDRFKAIVSGAPVTDQQSEYGTEDGSSYDRWFYGYPWEHHEDAWRQSALSTVGKAKTPFLLLQGEGDTVDPLGQSLEMYRALRQSGVPVEMVQYPRDNHGPLSGAITGNPVSEKWHGFDARRRIVRFIEKAFAP